MASRRKDVVVIWLPLAFIVLATVGLESTLLSASERNAPQKRGTKNIKVPRRLETAAKTLVYTKGFVINQ